MSWAQGIWISPSKGYASSRIRETSAPAVGVGSGSLSC